MKIYHADVEETGGRRSEILFVSWNDFGAGCALQAMPGLASYKFRAVTIDRLAELMHERGHRALPIKGDFHPRMQPLTTRQ